ncbi:MAG: hypothetical protein D6679_13800 [Candidatus Hydrogenedentota bacterium]|nr:MAG: hypothetical protein D6679_13800 [Candidatus Hydrogenedentota bacterium]
MKERGIGLFLARVSPPCEKKTKKIGKTSVETSRVTRSGGRAEEGLNIQIDSRLRGNGLSERTGGTGCEKKAKKGEEKTPVRRKNRG